MKDRYVLGEGYPRIWAGEDVAMITGPVNSPVGDDGKENHRTSLKEPRGVGQHRFRLVLERIDK